MKWTAEQLNTIAETKDLFVSPFREDGTTYGTPNQTWALVVDGNVYVRAANGQESRWYRAAVAQKAGRVRVATTASTKRLTVFSPIARTPGTSMTQTARSTIFCQETRPPLSVKL